MRRFFTIIVLLTVFTLNAEAQWDYSFGNKYRKTRKNLPVIGLKGGLTSYGMRFSNKYYDDLKMERLLKPGFGIFTEFPIERFPRLSVGAEILMIERGMRKSFDFRESVSETDEIDAKYIDFRIPVTYYFLDERTVSPYVFAAADFAFCYGGTVSKKFPNGEIDDMTVDISQSDALINPFDISVIGGAGVRFKIKFSTFTMPVKIEADYNFGLLNTMSKKAGTLIDVYAYSFDGEIRKNRGFEFMLGIGIPFKINRNYDACRKWN